MLTAIALFVSVSAAASGTFYLFLFLTRRRRNSDLWLGILGVAFAATYALYAFEDKARWALYSEAVIDAAIGLILLFNLRRLISYTFGKNPNPWGKRNAGHH